MKQVLQVRRSGMTVVRDVPSPPCPPGSMLVRNVYSAISSGTERARVELSQKSLLGKARERPDLVREVVTRARREGIRATMQAVQHRLDEETAVGYSSAGEVVEVGEHTRGFTPGDRVACAGGGHANHAELCAIPANLCVKVPSSVPLESAAITTIAAIAMHGIRLADVRVGSRVAVIGCGLVGQIALRLLRAAGAETFALDIDPERVRQSTAGGADHALVIDGSTPAQVLALTNGIGVDDVVVAAAAPTSEPLLLAAGVARDRGSVVLVGAVPIELPRGPLYDKELGFRVSRSYGPGRYDGEYEERGLDYPIGYVRWTEKRNMESVLRLQAQRLVSFEDLVEVVPVEEAARAYARLTGDPAQRPTGAIVLAYGGAEATAAPDSGNGASAVVGPDLSSHVEGGAKTASPGATVRIGLVGPGGFAGRILIPAFQAAGARLEVVGGGSGPSAASAARTGTFQRVATDASAVLTDPEVDAVVIATRHGSHASMVTEALMAGKHVFCEKPLALTTEEYETVISAAEGAPGTLMVGFNRRFSPLLRRMAAFLATTAAPATLTYRVSAGQLAPDHWTHDLVEGGGRALGEGCHFVDSLAYLAGSPVIEVHVVGYGPEARPVQAYDNLLITLRFASGSVGSIVYVADGSSGVPKERIEAFSGDRTVILDDYLSLELYRAGSHETERLKTQDKGHRHEVQEFVSGVRAGRPAIALAEIANSTLATLAVVESLRTGRPVRLEA
jgi:predicted dehydrogenase/threonine dehydrogenase-like Zn-dependent dehydrogenase